MAKHEYGEFYSWNVINENTVIKKCDTSFFEHNGSGVPKQIKWFFAAEELKYGDKRMITLIYSGKEYNVRLELVKNDRCRIIWHSDLAHKFTSFFSPDTEAFIRFYKQATDTYSVEFLDDTILDNEKEDPYESEVTSQKEGRKKEYYVSTYERKPKNRKKAIEIHGTTCMICGFDFESVYGEAGRNFIEVHHVKPLYEVGEEIVVNPETDLVCICANCHRIIHRKKDKVYSVEEVKAMLKK